MKMYDENAPNRKKHAGIATHLHIHWAVCCQPHRERVTIFTPNLKHDTFMRYRRQVETGEQWNSVPLLSSDNKKKASWKMEPKSIVTGSVNDGERLDAVLGFMFFR